MLFKAEEGAEAGSGWLDTDAGASGTSLSILLVEDDPQVLELQKALFEMDTHEVAAISNGTDALHVFDPDRFDLVVTDMEMPGMNGVELARKIKKKSPDKPVIMLTAYAETMQAAGKDSVGVDLIIPKPLTLAGLRKVVKAVECSRR